MSWDEQKYDEFVKKLETKYPEMFANPYGGVAVSEGWWPIIESLCGQISSYSKWKNSTRASLLRNNPYDHEIPSEVEQVVVAQIKEKFGGLRFYYDGGDEHISGMVRMAESWASHTCEECGKPGRSREGGWIRTLCDEHEAERQAQIKARLEADNDLRKQSTN